MRNLNYQLKQLCRNNRDGSFSTQFHRERMLAQIANQLHALGYRDMRSSSLKPKHVDRLVEHWQTQGLAIGTMKNRLSAIRWWAEKVNHQNVVARHNDQYGLAERVYVNGASKANALHSDKVANIADAHVRMSLELQSVFGLRREEAIKFNPYYADRGDHLMLKASWTKGSKARTVPVRTAAQRSVLDSAHRLVGKQSLIPGQRNYRQQLRVYERHTARAGLSKLHGLRHAYAQQRYEELTGWKAPVAGGPASKTLTEGEQRIDSEARLTISRELGHERAQVTVVYLGR